MAYLVDLLVGTRGTEAVETELLVRVALPAHGAECLDGQDGDTVGEDGESVLLALGIEDLEAGNGDNGGIDVVLLLEVGGSLDTDADLGTSGDEDDAGVGSGKNSVATLQSILNGRVLQLGQVLASEGQNARGVLGGQGRVVGSAGLVAVSRAPDHEVGHGTEVSQSLNGLVSRAVLTQTDGVVGGHVDDTDARERRQTKGTSSVGDEVQESTTGGDDGAVGRETVHDSSHAVLTHTIAQVATRPVTNTEVRGLEVNGVLPAGVVGASQISRSGEQFRDSTVDLLEDSLRQLAGSDSRVRRLVGREVLLPAFRQLASQTASEVLVLSLVLSAILLEELVPFLLLGGTLSGVLVVEVVHFLGDDEGLLRVETEELLDVLDVVRLQRVSVDTTGTLELGTETNGRGQLDDGGLVLDLLAPPDGGLDTLKVVVTVLDPLGVPAVGLETLQDILSESALGVTVYLSRSVSTKRFQGNGAPLPMEMWLSS